MPWFINRSGEQLWFESIGASGIPIFFLHGWCMSSAIWQFQLRGLPEGIRMIAPDLRGHGRSRNVHASFGFSDFVADLHDLIDFLGIESVILIGWSMGGQIALQASHDLPERVSGLVLVSATPSFTARPDYPHGLTQNETSGMRLKVQRNIGRALSGFRVRMFTESELAEPLLRHQITNLLDSIEAPETTVAIDALDSLAAADMRPLLPQILKPALVINGDCDPICLPSASGYLAENIRHSRHKVFYGCGHAPFLTQAELFNFEIIQYAGRVCVHTFQ